MTSHGYTSASKSSAESYRNLRAAILDARSPDVETTAAMPGPLEHIDADRRELRAEMRAAGIL